MEHYFFGRQGKLLFLITFFFALGCSDGGSNYDKDLKELLSELDLTDTEYPAIYVPANVDGCSAMTENFCDQLYDSKHKGNADLIADGRTFKIRFGDNSKGFSHGYSNFELAKWTSQRRLPEPLIGLLKSQNYFDLLKRFLKTKPLDESTPEEELETTMLSQETKAIWAWAINETVEQKVAEVLKQKGTADNFLERRLAKSKISKEVKASIYNIIWTSAPGWAPTVKVFEDVKKAFLEVLADPELNLDSGLRKKWLETIGEVKIIPPGSEPDHLDEDCATKQANAFYFPSRHYFTVCAGVIGAQDLSGTIAHELSHALGIGRTAFEYIKQTKYSAQMKLLRDQICFSNQTPSCPSEWENLKSHSAEWLDEVLLGWQPPVEKFLACLQYRQDNLKPWPPEKDQIEQISEMKAKALVSYLAGQYEFLKMSKAHLQKSDGSESKNPAFFNPCNDPDWIESDYEIGSVWDILFFFSASYMCGDSSKPLDTRLDAAITEARDVYQSVIEKEILLTKSFSADQNLAAYNYSENSEERFADALGYRVVAHLIENEPLEIRRARYLSTISDLCEQPSAMKQYPAELQAEKKHDLEPHSTGLRRRQELQVSKIREVLRCSKDFEIKDCEL